MFFHSRTNNVDGCPSAHRERRRGCGHRAIAMGTRAATASALATWTAAEAAAALHAGECSARELLKAAGYGRQDPIRMQTVYIAPPDDRRKERFRSHQAAVIRGTEEFAPSPELDSFVEQIKEACA